MVQQASTVLQAGLLASSLNSLLLLPLHCMGTVELQYPPIKIHGIRNWARRPSWGSKGQKSRPQAEVILKAWKSSGWSIVTCSLVQNMYHYTCDDVCFAECFCPFDIHYQMRFYISMLNVFLFCGHFLQALCNQHVWWCYYERTAGKR